MKVVILAGGYGTRISEYTKSTPKPMIKINSKPLLTYIMKHFYNYGYKNFIIALGYKSDYVKKYFKLNKKKYSDYNIQLINTGLNTMTGGRIKKLKKYLSKERFFLTYGDGVSDVNLKKLLKFHLKQKNTISLTAVRPPGRFGVVKFKKNRLAYFKEKSNVDQGWINGGFFVVEPKFLKFIKNDKTYLEREPLERACKKKTLGAYKHFGFWHCVDTKRDLDSLSKILKNEKIIQLF